MCSVGEPFWKSSGRLADGREIIYFDESPGLGRASVPDKRPLAQAPAGTGPGLAGGGGRAARPRGGLPPPRLRWDAPAGGWGIIAAPPPERAFLPRPTEGPLDPSGPGRLTEIPAPDYDVVVFENRFPALRGLPALAHGPGTHGAGTQRPGTLGPPGAVPAVPDGPPETGGVPGRPPT